MLAINQSKSSLSLKSDNSYNPINDNSLNSNWKARIKNEILALSEIYTGNVIIIKPNEEITVEIIPDTLKLYKKNPQCKIELLIIFKANYPKVPPQISFKSTYNFEKKELEEIEKEINEIKEEYCKNNMEMIHEICQLVQNEVNERARKFEPNLNISLSSLDNNISDNEEGKKNINQNNKNINTNAFENMRNAMLENSVRNDDSQSKKSKSSENSKKKNIKNKKKNKELNEEENSSSISKDLELNIIDSDNNESIMFSDNGKERISNISNQINTSYIHSRFHSEFTQIEKLGQGGGGSVFKVRNNFDKMIYAIKRILFIIPKNKNSQKVISNVQGEAFVLARLQNPFIVRYYQTWIEDYNVDDVNGNEDEDFIEEYEYNDEDDKMKNSIKQNEGRKLSFEKKTSNFELDKKENSFSSDNIVFGTISKSNKNKGNGIWDDSESSNSDSDEFKFEMKEESIEKKHYRKESKEEKLQRIKTIYIQMEYCEGKTLREVIDKKKLTNDDQKWKLITQILEGVRFIHSKQLIHRDLKPGNIFLDSNYNVKIGDFGLAKITKSKNQLEQLNNNQKYLFDIGNNDLMTYAIGTKYYCSPEQENSTHYTYKSDIFSLGIIIFEMFYYFNSLMERNIVLRGIKEDKKYPKDFEDICPSNVVKIVKLCTNHNPKERPSAQDLLNSKLIPYVLNEKNVVDNFNDIIEDNQSFSSKFLEILIQKNLNNMYSDNYLCNNLFFKKFEDSQIMQLLHKKEINIQPHLYYYIMELINFKIKSTFHENHVCYKRLTEIELFSNFNKINVNNEVINLNEENKSIDYPLDELMLSKSGEIIYFSENIIRNFSKFIQNFEENKLLQNLIPITFYSDSLITNFNKTRNLKIQYNDISYFSIWGNVNNEIEVDYDEKYVADSFKIIFQLIKNLEISKSILIRVNSSNIFDKIFNQILGKKENIKKIQLKTLLEISKVFNVREGEISFKELKKLIINHKVNIPISIENLNELITWMNINGDLNSILKRFGKKLLYDEIKKLSEYLKYSHYWVSFFDERKYLNKIKIDFSLIPNNLIYYSDFFFQICYIDHKNKKIPLFEGGRIDNYFDNLTNAKNIHGFSYQIYLENLFLIYENKFREVFDFKHFKYDILIINNSDLKESKDEIGKFLTYVFKDKKVNLKIEIIFKKQNKIDFDFYFKIYKMKFLIVLINEENKFKYKIHSYESKNNFIIYSEKSEVFAFINPKNNKK